MNLYELEGKQLFENYNINVPKGSIYSSEMELNYPLIAKAQVLTGGRGLAGGIKKVRKKEELHEVINEISQLSINSEKTKEVYLEELVNYSEEKYLSIFIDRNSKSTLIIASNDGGVNIEQVPKNKILTLKVSLFHGIQNYMIKRLSDFLNIEYKEIEELLNNLWRLYTENNAELIEINPLFILEDNSLVAGDSKIVIDDNVILENVNLLERDNSSFESKCKSVNASGAQLEGDVAIIASGAGLGMATLDIVRHNGLEANCLVDLQGHVIHDLEDAKRLISYVKELQPKIIFFNYYFQLASCLTLSKAIATELDNSDIKVYLRMKGRDETSSRNLLENLSNIYIDDDLLSISQKLMEDDSNVYSDK